jgi:hypothetical protein
MNSSLKADVLDIMKSSENSNESDSFNASGLMSVSKSLSISGIKRGCIKVPLWSWFHTSPSQLGLELWTLDLKKVVLNSLSVSRCFSAVL